MNLKLPQPAPFEPNHKTPIQSNNETYPTPASSSGLPVATALLYQDDEVNIWENRLLKHMDGPLHTHDYDYWLAFAKGLTKCFALIGETTTFSQSCIPVPDPGLQIPIIIAVHNWNKIKNRLN